MIMTEFAEVSHSVVRNFIANTMALEVKLAALRK